jgi:hypothetical protein
MRRLFAVIASVLVIGGAGPAAASVRAFVGSLTFSLLGNDLLVPGAGWASIPGAVPSGHLTSLATYGNVFTTAGYVRPVPGSSAEPIRGVQLTVWNGPGAFSGSPLGGVMGLAGTAKVCLFGPCSAAAANLEVPLSPVGAGGSAIVTAGVNLTVIGAPWTTGTVAIGTATAMGSAAPASNTFITSGTVSLVTPVFVSTNIPASTVVPVFGLMRLLFVPEPDTLALLAGGLVALVAYGRRCPR